VRSPLKVVPEVWKPLEDDPSAAKSYNLGRRGSSASMKSTGSGRPTISATVPERIDEADGSWRSNYEPERSGNFMDKDERGGCKNSRPPPVDDTNYREEPLASTPLKSAEDRWSCN
jgi:hypothetical protein